ncbi:MAG: septation protein A [Pseudomonadota bacterium]
MTQEISEGQAGVEERTLHPLLKFALELGPLALFFLANSYGERFAEYIPFLAGLGGNIYIATAVFMVAMVVSLSISWALVRSLPIMPLVSLVVVLVFGGLTLYLQNETFIKLKPTIVNVFFGSVLMIGLLYGKSLLAYVFDSAFKITDEGWRILTFRWALFFFFLAVLNEVIWRSYSTDFWVAFKVWGVMPITMAFAMSQLPLLNRHSLEDEVPEGGSSS